MTIRKYAGLERDRRISRAGCCQDCGFQEQALVAWECLGSEAVHCEECFIHQTCLQTDDARLVYLPEMPVEAFSNYVRVLSWASFAARSDTLRGHDFSMGTLPNQFSEKSTWEAPMIWKSLDEGLRDDATDPVARGDLRKVIEASAFLVERIEYTAKHHCFKTAAEACASLGHESFRRDFRVMHKGIPLSRIRSWGGCGSTFSMLAAKKRPT